MANFPKRPLSTPFCSISFLLKTHNGHCGFVFGVGVIGRSIFVFPSSFPFLLEKQRFIFVQKRSPKKRKSRKPSFAAKSKTLGIFKEPSPELSVTLQLVKTTKVFIKIDCVVFVFDRKSLVKP